MAEERKRRRDEEIVKRGENIGEGLLKFTKTLQEGKKTFAEISARNAALRKFLDKAQDTQNKDINETSQEPSYSPPRPH